MELTAAQLAALVQGEVVGDASVKVNNFARIEEGKAGCLSFLANPKYTHYLYQTESSVILVRKDFIPEYPVRSTLIKVEDPYATLAKLLEMAGKETRIKKGIEQPCHIPSEINNRDDIYVGAFSYIGENVQIGKNVQIYPQCFIGDNVSVGDNVVLYPGVKIYHGCVIGNNAIIHSGVVIGSDGFGFAPENGEFVKIAQIGNVVIEDNVEIGANTTIDRATMGSTVIKKGVKLDNLIQIAHNVEIGEHTVMAAQVGVAGSAKIGKYNMVGGQVGFAGHIVIGDFNRIGAQSGIPNNVGSENTLMGYPAVNSKDFARQAIYVKNLGKLNKEVQELRKTIEELKKK